MKNVFRLEIDYGKLDAAQVELFLKHSLGISCKVEPLTEENLNTSESFTFAQLPIEPAPNANFLTALSEGERHFQEITDTVPVLIWIADANRNCTYFNKTWLAFTGRPLERELGDGWAEGVHPEDLNESIRVSQEGFARREPFEKEYRLRRHDGEYRWVLDKGLPRFSPEGRFVGFIGICVDITDFKNIERNLRESEAQLRQSQKLEAVGKLSGGIAHDFNNLLSVIMLHVDMLKLQLGPESPYLFRIDEIKSAAQRAASLTRQLLALSRRQMLQPRPVSLNLVVIEIAKMLRRLIGEDIELKLDLAPDLDIVMVDPDQMSQVLMNLALNSRDAMPDGGELIIQTCNIRFDTNTPMVESQPFGNYVQLQVADTGSGMPPEVLERIFDPFFTTKEAGKGTGLGLSTVYGIIKQSGGYIAVSSEVGVGSAFTIQLPQAESRSEGIGLEERERLMIVGSETILLVEDEEMIRKAAHEVLVVLGYRVLEAKDGFAALNIVNSYDDQIDLLLTDVVMPKMSGGELAKVFQELRPGVPVLYMSGYTDDVVVRYGVLRDGMPFIEKPFSPSSLGYKIREVLEPKSA